MENEAAKLAKSYSEYLVVDVDNDVKSVEDAIDDTLTRLDEFSGLVDLIKNQNHPEVAADILSKKGELFELFQRIRKLEFVMSQVRQTVDTFEHVVTAAETELNATAEGKIKNFLKPFFKKKTPASGSMPPPDAVVPKFTSPPIFNTKEIFSKPNVL